MKPFILIFLFIGIYNMSVCQSIEPTILSNAGFQYQDDNIQFEGTLGEPLIFSLQENDVLLSQGFHQNEIIITSIDEANTFQTSISIFPNPSSDRIYLEFDKESLSSMQAKLFDRSGKLLIDMELEGLKLQHQINITDLTPGIYTLNIFDTEQHKNAAYQVTKF